MPLTPGTKQRTQGTKNSKGPGLKKDFKPKKDFKLKKDPGLKKDSSVESDEGLGGAVYRTQNYFQRNLKDIVVLTILSGMTLINFSSEAKLTSLNFFYIVILFTGYALGKRFAVLSAFLTILIVWSFILADNSPYLAHNTRSALNFHMTIWGGFLILTGWLGSALAKIFYKETTDELFISPKSSLKKPE